MCDETDRERLALYLAGLLPSDHTEAAAVLALTARLIPILTESRQGRAANEPLQE